MKFGNVIGICSKRDEDQLRSIESIRKFSEPETQMVAVFNGVEPFPLPDGIEVMAFPHLLGREQGLWKVAFDLAVERGWTFVGNFHDDFFLEEPGWEAFTREQCKTYKVGISSYVAWGFLSPRDTSPVPHERHDWTMESGDPPQQPMCEPLGISIDGCGVAWNMQLFRRRGRFTNIEAVCGYGEMEAGLWALTQGWACIRIPLRAHHHPGLTSNARTALNLPATGQHETIAQHLGVLPAEVYSSREVRLGGHNPTIPARIVDVTWRAHPRVQVLRPSYGPEEEEAVVRALRSGWTSSGPETQAFENEMAAYLGEGCHVVAVSSGTAALHLALVAAGIGPGDEVIVPPLTFVSTAHAVRYCGATPVFADVDPLTLCLDPVAVERAITPKTKAILPVHLYGRPADMERLGGLAEQRGILVIEDCAHAMGATYYDGGDRVGRTDSIFCCFSFHAVKNLSMGEGGAVVCRSAALAERLRRLRWCGIDKETFARARGSYRWQYDVTEVGFKYQLSELSAAVGRVQLQKLDAANTRRREIARAYREGLSDLPWLELPAPSTTSSWHLFVVRVAERARFIEHLASRNVEASVHYMPLNLYRVYEGYPCETPVAHREWQRLVSLPMHAGMTDDDVAAVVAAVRSFDP